VSAKVLQTGKAAAPPVLEFAPDGTLLSSWGGPGAGYDWPKEEHGIYVDRHDNVWLAGAGDTDAQILKFTSKGKFLLQIGHPGQSHGSNDTENLGAPANMVVDEAANELYVADGYVNHRVIVFDAKTGAYKRHWGAYGKRPDDSYYTKLGIKPGQHTNDGSKAVPTGASLPQFDLVHSVRISKDGLVYACDRSNNRIQVFHKDGTFIREVFIANTRLASGSTSDIGFSVDPQQRFAFVEDSTNNRVYILDRKSLKVLSTIGGPGREPGQFRIAHNMAVNSKGDLFITESAGARVQKFVQAGTKDADAQGAY
jgi:DNA-binding beta-propeller fold protein YncE